MASDQVTLQCFQLMLADADVAELAEAGIDSVGGLSAGYEAFHDCAGVLHASTGVTWDYDWVFIEGDGGYFFQGQRSAVEFKSLLHLKKCYGVQQRVYMQNQL